MKNIIKSCDSLKKKIIIRSTLGGILFGFLFPVGAIFFEFILQRVSFSINNISTLHMHNHLLYMIDTAPFFLGIFAFFIGVNRANTEKVNCQLKEYIEKLEDMVNERTKELTIKNDTLTESIEYAKKIQQSILTPHQDIQKVISRYFTIWRPRDIVGGDFYWSKKFDDGFLIIVGDCTGHGVPGAMMTMMVSSILSYIVCENNHKDPASILRELDEQLSINLNRTEFSAHSISDGLDAAVLFITNKDNIIYSGAKMSLFLCENNEVTEVAGGRKSIGSNKRQQTQIFENIVLALNPNTAVYISTDGALSVIGGETGKPFGKARFKNLLANVCTLPIDEQKNSIMEALRAYEGDQLQRDDITILGLIP